MPMFSRLLHFILALFLMVLGKATLHAEDWPSRPITLVSASAPGSSAEITARAIAHEMSIRLGQPVIVEIKPGSGGVIASSFVAKAPPDGYTLLVSAIGPAVIRPLMDKQIPYDMKKDFTPIVLFVESPNVLAISKKSTWNSVKDLISYAKANPGKLTIGHPGPGTMGHLLGLLLANEAGIEVNLVAYKGAAPAMKDIAGEHIHAGSFAYGPGVENIRLLAVTAGERVRFLPQIPAMRETGFPNVTGRTWLAVYGPAGLPPAIVTKINSAVNAGLNSKELKEKLEKIGLQPLGGPPERLTKQMEDDHAKWSKVIEKAKLTQ